MRRTAAGESPELIFEIPASLSWTDWCPLKPGASCVLAQVERNDTVFYALDPVRGKGVQLGKTDATVLWHVSADGSHLAWINVLKPGPITVLNLADHTLQKIPIDPRWKNFYNLSWAADGKGFFLSSFFPYSSNLIHVTLSGRVHVLLSRPRGIFMRSVLPSPDGKFLAFQAVTRGSNAWLLENF
ncbi:MAG TPA: hypothetical protein VIW93_04170 [Candidatus Acidoferrum sp.]